jgi:hypothetical protein
MQGTAEPKPMAKKKAKRMKPGETRRSVAVVIKGSAEWKAWVEEGADHCRLSVSTLADLAIAAYVKAQGFKREPPKR